MTPTLDAAGLAVGPRRVVTERLTCVGCPALKTECWHETLENDETDSGTSARCAAADNRSITAYWRDGDAPPAWCPATAYLASAEPAGWRVKPPLSLLARDIFSLALKVAHAKAGFSGPTTDYFGLQLVGHGPFIEAADAGLLAIKHAFERVAKSGKSTMDELNAADKARKKATDDLVADLCAKFGGSALGPNDSPAKQSAPLPAAPTPQGDETK